MFFAIAIIVLANMTDSHESAFNQRLLKKYFDNKTTTLKFYRFFSQTLKELIFGSNTALILSWNKFKNYENEICPLLETYQKEALVEWTQIRGPKKPGKLAI